MTTNEENMANLPPSSLQPSVVQHSVRDSKVDAPEESSPYHLAEDVDWNKRLGTLSVSKAQVYQYLSSNSAKELISCVVLGTFFYFIGYAVLIPNQRPIPYQVLDDGSYVINLTFNEERQDSTVPEWQMGLLCVILCPLLQLVIGASKFGAVGDMHTILCVYWLAIPFNELVTWTLKVYVGYLRPNFYTSCQPSDDYQTCTAADDQVNDGEYGWDLRQSFPSGHASWAFCALTLVYLYLERSFGLSSIQYVTYAGTVPESHNSAVVSTDDNNHQIHQQRLVLKYRQPSAFGYRLRSILCVAPLLLAVYIATSRVVDNKHFPADIIAGSLVGASVATFFHNLWFIDPRFR